MALFTLTPDIKAIATDAIDSLIAQLGKKCLLIYPPIPVLSQQRVGLPVGAVNNAVGEGGNPTVVQDITNSSQENDVAWSVDAQVFNAGTGTWDVGPTVVSKVNLTDTITLLVKNQPSQFWNRVPGVNVPAGTIQVKGYISDLPKVLRANEIILQPELRPAMNLRYVRAGEAIDVGNIIQSRYFVLDLKRVG